MIVTRPQWLPTFNATARGASARPWTVSETHHLVPLSWGGADVNDNKARLSAQLHHDAHACMNEYVRHSGPPPASVLSTFSAKAQSLAAYAWANLEPGHPTPYWLPAHAPIVRGETEGEARVRAFMGWPASEALVADGAELGRR